MVLGPLDIHMRKKMNLDKDLAPFIKIKWKWIQDLNVKCKNITLLEDNIRENFKDRTPKLISWTSLNLKTSALQKAMLIEWEEKPQTGKTICIDTSVYYPKYTKPLKIQRIRKTKQLN